MFEGKEVKVILAQSGAGKTTNFMKLIAKDLETKRPEEIAFVTFTRKGAEEGVRRMCNNFMYEPSDLPYFRTLHSLTFHALNLKGNQMFSHIHEHKFNKEYGYDLNRCDAANGNVHETRDSAYLDFYDLERSGALTSQMLAEADIELGYYHQLVQKYEEYKSRQCLVDFFDCLIKYVREGGSLPCKVVYVDECFSPDTKVRMADMSVKAIKDIKAGDYVMGTSGAVKVTNTCYGIDTMYDVVSGKQKVLFTCNSKHLVEKYRSYNWVHAENIGNKGRVTFTSIEGKDAVCSINPYFFGLWLGNGFSREAVVVCNEKDYPTIEWLKCYGENLGDKVTLRKRQGIVQVEYSAQTKGKWLKCNVRKQLESFGFLLNKTRENAENNYKEKSIPSVFLQADIETRLELLAGIIDSDGMLVKAGNSKKYRIEMVRKELMENIFDLVSSLGFNPTWYVTHHTTNGITRDYYRVDFYNQFTIPCKLPRKQREGDFKSSGVPCRVIKKGIGNYCGITVDSADHCFILANGCIVHNCQDITALQWEVIEKAFSNAEKIYITGDTSQSIYTYSGARPDILLKLARQYPLEYLSSSYRLPRKVFELAKGIVSFISEKIEEMPFDFHEGNPEGTVTQLNSVERLKNFIEEPVTNKTEATWYLLVRNKCFLPKFYALLEDNLIPYWTADGFFMGGQIMTRLTDYEGFRLEGYRNEVKKEQFKKKFGIEDFSKPFTDTNLFTEGRAWVYASYIEKYGLEKLKEMCKWNPQILVSTIHYVKGGEAENVAVMLDNTRKTSGVLYKNIDEELRVLYVGVTRTKRNLFLIDSINGQGYDKIITTLKDQFNLRW